MTGKRRNPPKPKDGKESQGKERQKLAIKLKAKAPKKAKLMKATQQSKTRTKDMSDESGEHHSPQTRSKPSRGAPKIVLSPLSKAVSPLPLSSDDSQSDLFASKDEEVGEELDEELEDEDEEDDSTFQSQSKLTTFSKKLKNKVKAPKKVFASSPLQLSQEVEEQVVEWIKSNPLLFDKADEDYRKIGQKHRMWEEKAESLGITHSQLTTWYESLRTRFGRLTKKKSGDGAKRLTSREQWILKVFSFLEVHIHRHAGRKSCDVSKYLIILK